MAAGTRCVWGLGLLLLTGLIYFLHGAVRREHLTRLLHQGINLLNKEETGRVYPPNTTFLLTKPRNEIRPAVSLSGVDLTRTVFVTAADASHFEETRDSIASLQQNLPHTHTLLYYDLGLKPAQVEEVKTWCRVVNRKFPFQYYLKHVRKMKAFAWKVILVNNLLPDYPAVAWFDASMRFKCPNFMQQLEPTLRRSGVVMTDNTGHSTFAVTHPHMYKYLPSNMSLLMRTEQIGSCFFIVVNTPHVVDTIMTPWVKCGMLEDCTFAGKIINCNFKRDRWTRYAGCHRPQSALNILLAEEHHGDLSMYHAKGTCVHIIRTPTSMYKLHKC